MALTEHEWRNAQTVLQVFAHDTCFLNENVSRQQRIHFITEYIRRHMMPLLTDGTEGNLEADLEKCENFLQRTTNEQLAIHWDWNERVPPNIFVDSLLHATSVNGSWIHSMQQLRRRAAHLENAQQTSSAFRVVAQEVSERRHEEIQMEILRDIVGNPFHPLVVDPGLLTRDVTAIARCICEERRFVDMPVLGDALEEAGCTNEDILRHCKDASIHVRGCHVLEAVLCVVKEGI